MRRPAASACIRSLRAALSYFALGFSAGFALGLVRVPILVPRLGERMAELVEMPPMLLVVILSARFVVRRYALDPSVGCRLRVGATALALLLGVEFTVVLAVRGLTIGAYFATRDPISGGMYAIMLVLFALMPALVDRR